LSDADRNAPAFGVYVHWPFCLSKCPYCDFNSHVRQGGIDETRYVAAYAAEIASSAARTGKRIVSTIFFGGGTPSLMSPQTVAAILDTGPSRPMSRSPSRPTRPASRRRGFVDFAPPA